MNTAIKILFTLVLIGLSTGGIAQVADSCPRPDAIDIALDGSTATEGEVLDAQAQAQNYADATYAYIECLELYAQTAPAEEHEALTAIYQDVLGERQAIIDDFNAQVRTYSERTQVSPYAEMQSASECPRPDSYSLNLDGNTASESEMMAAQAGVRDFTNGANAYMNCLRDVMPRMAVEEQDRIVELYNEMNTELMGTADAFNAQVRAFRARTEASGQ